MFLSEISQKAIDTNKLIKLQNVKAQCLVTFVMVSPPSYFYSMTLLLVHLVIENLILGYVFVHNLFPFEMFMEVPKKYVHYCSYLEGCINKDYGIEEVMEFCVDFISDLILIGIPMSRHEG